MRTCVQIFDCGWRKSANLVKHKEIENFGWKISQIIEQLSPNNDEQSDWAVLTQKLYPQPLKGCYSCWNLTVNTRFTSFRKIRLRREVAEARRRTVRVHRRGGHQRPPETWVTVPWRRPKPGAPNSCDRPPPKNSSSSSCPIDPPSAPKLLHLLSLWLFWKGGMRVSTPGPSFPLHPANNGKRL